MAWDRICPAVGGGPLLVVLLTAALSEGVLTVVFDDVAPTSPSVR
jgi:hypothetical protein